LLQIAVTPDGASAMKSATYDSHVLSKLDQNSSCVVPGNRIQRAVKTRAKTEFVFGRNEGPCQRFHGWVDQLVAAGTETDTAALFADATEFHHP